MVGLAPSVAVIVGWKKPVPWMRPETTPVSGSMSSPVGRPVAEKVIGSSSGSTATMASEISSPSRSDCGPGSVNTGPWSACTTVHSTVRITVTFPSVTCTVLSKVPAWFGVPETTPVPLSIDRPLGRSVAKWVRTSASASVAPMSSDTGVPVVAACAPGSGITGGLLPMGPITTMLAMPVPSSRIDSVSVCEPAESEKG